jgi:predicted DNA binding protein/PAS domain-containing protein
VNEALRRAPVGVVETTPEGVVVDANEAAATVLSVARADLCDEALAERFPESAAGTLRAAFADGVASERTFEEYYPTVDRWLRVSLVPTDDRVVVYVRDCSDRHDHRRRAERLDRRLERSERINGVVSTVLRALLDASDREDVAETVCEGVGAVDRYGFCWVGDRRPASGRVELLAATGTATETRARIVDHLGGDHALPERVAVDTGETQSVAAIADDESVPEPIRTAAFARGLQSLVAVPLAYRGVVYGVLGVYSTSGEGVGEHERASLETLGAVAGFAVHAARQAALVDADTVTELTVEVRDPTTPFVAAARAGDTRLSVDPVVRRDDGTTVCYARTPGASDAVTGALSAHDAVETVRQVRTSPSETLLETALAGPTPTTALAARAARVDHVDATADGVELVAHVAPDATARDALDAVAGTADDVDLAGKRSRPRTATTVETFRDALDGRLTERQRTALRTAYAADYFESPRGSTAAEVASALGITGPTLLYHLRAAQRKLLDALFAADRPADEDASDRPER